MSVTRDELHRLLRDALAIETAGQLYLVAIPDEKVLSPLRQHTSTAANKLLDEFEKELVVNAVRHIIVNDVRSQLLKRTRLTKAVEWGLALTTLASSFSVGAGQYVFIEHPNIEALSSIYWACFGLMALSAIGFLYLKLVDMRCKRPVIPAF